MLYFGQCWTQKNIGTQICIWQLRCLPFWLPFDFHTNAATTITINAITSTARNHYSFPSNHTTIRLFWDQIVTKVLLPRLKIQVFVDQSISRERGSAKCLWKKARVLREIGTKIDPFIYSNAIHYTTPTQVYGHASNATTARLTANGGQYDFASVRGLASLMSYC